MGFVTLTNFTEQWRVIDSLKWLLSKYLLRTHGATFIGGNLGTNYVDHVFTMIIVYLTKIKS